MKSLSVSADDPRLEPSALPTSGWVSGAPRLYKEGRELFPAFAGSVLLILACGLWLQGAEFGYFAFALSCGLLGASTFGNEFHHRTLPLLLSQPASRALLWRDKMLALGTGIVGSLAVLLSCQGLYGRPAGFSLMGLLVLVLIGLCGFCGTPYWTLVTRHGIVGAVSAAFPLSLLMVGALVLQLAARVFKPVQEHSELVGAYGAATLLLGYCVVVYRLGWAQFKTLQVLDTPAAELRLPARCVNLLAPVDTWLSTRLTGPFTSLVRKEFHLQQVSFLLTGVFCLLVLGAMVTAVLWRTGHPEIGQAIFGPSLVLHVLLLPLVAGAVSLAEERGWGLAEWHLTLPPSTLKQWGAKMLVTLSSSLTLGVLLPAALFVLAQWLFGRGPDGSVGNALPLLLLAQLLLTSLAVYAASVSTSALRAILLTLGLVVFIGFASRWGVLGAQYFIELLPGPVLLTGGQGVTQRWQFLVWLQIGAGLFVMACLSQGFAFSNFRQRGLGARRYVFQVLALGLLAAAMAFAITAGVLFNLRSA